MPNVSLHFSRLYVLTLLISGYVSAQAQQCPAIGVKAVDTIAFLKNAREGSGIADKCVIDGIHKLYHVNSTEAIDVLIGYLDLKRSYSETIQVGSNSDLYPAVDALFSIGRPAVPALLRVIKGDGYSKQAQENAVRTIMLIYRDEPSRGIRLLVDEGEGSSNSGERTSLREAATFALRWCIGKNRVECEAALAK